MGSWSFGLGRGRRAWRELAVPWSLAVLVGGCGDAGPPVGTIPIAAGRYVGTWTIAVDDQRIACPAAITVNDLTDTTFGTTFEQRRRSGDELTCVDTVLTGSGRVQPDRTIAALTEVIEPPAGSECALREVNTGVSGALTTAGLMLAGSYTYRCVVDARWTFAFGGNAAGPELPKYPDLGGTYAGAWTTSAAGDQVSCPVTIVLVAEQRGRLAGGYVLQAAPSCGAEPELPLSGSVTVDGDLALRADVPVPPAGCAVGDSLFLSGTGGIGKLNLVGGFTLACQAGVRSFVVRIAAASTAAARAF